MTKAEMLEIAQMTASILSNNGSQKPQNASGEEEEVETVVATTEAVKTARKASQGHIPSVSPEQVRDVLNEARMEVRIQSKYPLVAALEEAFAGSKLQATVKGQATKVITQAQFDMIVDHLKAHGKFWPNPVVTILDEQGERIYMNTSFKREEGEKWLEGKSVKFKAPKAEEVQA